MHYLSVRKQRNTVKIPRAVLADLLEQSRPHRHATTEVDSAELRRLVQEGSR